MTTGPDPLKPGGPTKIRHPLVRVVRGPGVERRPESSGLPHEAPVRGLDEPQAPTRRPPRGFRVNSWRPLNRSMELAYGLAAAKPAGLDPHRVLTKGALDSPIRGNLCFVGSATVSAIPVSEDGIHNARFLAEGRRRAARHEEGEPSEGFRRKNSITREKCRFPPQGSDLHYILQRSPIFLAPCAFAARVKSPELTEEGGAGRGARARKTFKPLRSLGDQRPRPKAERPLDSSTRQQSGSRRAKSPREEEARVARAPEGPGSGSSPFGRAASRCAPKGAGPE